ncbi:MCP four helix bundle domain-containing protein [Pedobacter faecalis]|uniref:MCP four helix bundle domain-containing protein n=1 Tax=Pedobacter faecalis TaxID=3041495 RepID=UPI00254BC798|nr:MCP four helix bundle domain-containing protein [Pedobacter sp. ELA7]
MKIKTKLRLGFGFLFLVVIFFGAVSLHYMNKISVSARVILKDNYESLRYAREIRSILDDNDLPLSAAAVEKLKMQLELEQQKITEPGEAKAVADLSGAFTALTRPGSVQSAQRSALRQMHLQLRS